MRVDIQGVRHNSLSERLLADMDYLYRRLEERLYTIKLCVNVGNFRG